jgi:hypothetical protein
MGKEGSCRSIIKGGTMTVLVVFTLGYTIGGVSALVLIGLTLAGRHTERIVRGAD